MTSPEIAAIRKDYILASLTENDVDQDAIKQFSRWWNEALASHIDEINAMTLATASAEGVPDARIVLLKGFDEKGFVFFTNYESSKGRQLAANPRAALVFFWKELERQIRISGLVEKVSAEESNDYFNSRPEGSRLGAWASPQSTVIPDRTWLENREEELRKQFDGKAVTRPEHWGGYRLRPLSLEFWQGRASRLHDRIRYVRKGESWKIERLAP